MKGRKVKVCTYSSLRSGAIFRMLSKNLLSQHHIEGFWGWLLTFNILKRMHRMTAIAANNAVDIVVKICFKSGNCKSTLPNWKNTGTSIHLINNRDRSNIQNLWYGIARIRTTQGSVWISDSNWIIEVLDISLLFLLCVCQLDGDWFDLIHFIFHWSTIRILTFTFLSKD